MGRKAVITLECDWCGDERPPRYEPKDVHRSHELAPEGWRYGSHGLLCGPCLKAESEAVRDALAAAKAHRRMQRTGQPQQVAHASGEEGSK